MSVRPLCVAPDPVLRRPARPVVRFTKELQRLARDLIETMYANDGIGLAAPQIGHELAVCVANPSQQRGQEIVVVNPSVEARRGRVRRVEGCLSLPEVWGPVTRAAQVRIRGQDLAGSPVLMMARGLLAIVLQHEVDHLHGRLFIDRLPWWRRRLLNRAAERTHAR
jgi:peptide deformylase